MYETFLFRSSNKYVTEDFAMGAAELKVKLSLHSGNCLPLALRMSLCIPGSLKAVSLEFFQLPVC